MRLLYSPPSPYSSKVRMAAHLCGFELELVRTDTSAEGAELTGTNPIGKIPALMLDDGTGVYDSRVICEYFDRSSGNLLIPQTIEGWMQARRVEALADGIAEAAMATFYEKRYRPEEKWHQPWIDKQWRRALRSLDILEKDVAALPEQIGLAHFAVAADLGWLELRYPGTFADRNPDLAEWYDGFWRDHPEYEAMRPAG